MAEGCVRMAGVVAEWAVRVKAEVGSVDEVMDGAGCEGAVRAVEGLAEAGWAVAGRERTASAEAG